MKGASANRTRHARVSGFTLLEVLIALVILSIGLLGIAGLQGVGLKSSHGAYLTSQASLLAYDMADRIRANPQNLATYSGFTSSDIDCTAALPTTSLAAADLAEWGCAVTELLPAGTGTINGVLDVTTDTTTYTIALQWEDLQVEEAAPPWSFSLVVDL